MSQSSAINGSVLPDELVRLIHYVELHKSGWWDQALDKLVLASLWLEGPITPEQLSKNLVTMLNGRLSSDRVFAVIERERAAGAVVQLGDGRVKLVEEVERTYRAEADAIAASEVLVKDLLIAAGKAHGVDALEKLWDNFLDEFLRLLITQSGARVYDLITGAGALDSQGSDASTAVAAMVEVHGSRVKDVLIGFLDPKNPAVRDFILRRLNASFVKEAASLSSEVLDVLTSTQQRTTELRVLLDTNFVFSFLGLHDNPSNEVATELMALADQVSARVRVRFFVLPITVDELKHTIGDVIQKLSGVRATENLAAAASRLSASGLVNGYLAAAARSGLGALSPQDFFGPYESDLLEILRGRNIELYNANLDSLRTDPKVVDDLHDQQEAQAKYRKQGVKPYESNLHDMVLWHFAKSRRPSHTESPLGADIWVCTVDYGFIAFDRSKRKGRREIPLCLSPTSLVQLLQFWAPRSEEMDTALVGSIREPLLFLDFDRASENTTISIIRTLSRFENVGDLSVDTVYQVLTNDALRSSMGALTGPNNRETELGYVEAAIVEEARKTEAELERLRLEREREREQLANKASVADERSVALEQAVDAKDARIEELSLGLREAQAKLTDQNGLNASLKQQIVEQDQMRGRIDELEAARRRSTDMWAISATGAGLGLIVVLLGCGAVLYLRRHISYWITCPPTFVFIAGSWLLAMDYMTGRRPSLAQGRLRKRVQRARRGLGAAVVTVVLALVAAGIWQAVTSKAPTPSRSPSTTADRGATISG